VIDSKSDRCTEAISSNTLIRKDFGSSSGSDDGSGLISKSNPIIAA
jgi:hypothetical protein